MPNPDFPAPIKQKIFTLDLDASYQSLQEQVEISTNLDKFHDKIQSLFEMSITANLREILNAQK